MIFRAVFGAPKERQWPVLAPLLSKECRRGFRANAKSQSCGYRRARPRLPSQCPPAAQGQTPREQGASKARWPARSLLQSARGKHLVQAGCTLAAKVSEPGKGRRPKSQIASPRRSRYPNPCGISDLRRSSSTRCGSQSHSDKARNTSGQWISPSPGAQCRSACPSRS